MKYSEWKPNQIDGVGEERTISTGGEWEYIKIFRYSNGPPKILVRSRGGIELAGPFKLSREATFDLIAALIGTT